MSVVPIIDLELVKNEANYFDVDLSTDLDVEDSVWFTAKYRKSDADADAVISKTRAGGGIIDVDTPTGKCQVQLDPTDCDDLVGRALVYDVKLKKADVDQISTVVMGVIRLVESTNHEAA